MINKDDKITVLAAYTAMYDFLEKEFELTQSSDIAVLLNGMSMLEDGSSADAAAWVDWLDSVKKAQNNECDIRLKILPKD